MVSSKDRGRKQIIDWMTGLQSAQTLFMVSMMANRGLGYRTPLYVHDNFAHLAVASIITAFVVSIGVYIKSFVGKPRLLALGGNTGNTIYDVSILGLFLDNDD